MGCGDLVCLARSNETHDQVTNSRSVQDHRILRGSSLRKPDFPQEEAYFRTRLRPGPDSSLLCYANRPVPACSNLQEIGARIQIPDNRSVRVATFDNEKRNEVCVLVQQVNDKATIAPMPCLEGHSTARSDLERNNVATRTLKKVKASRSGYVDRNVLPTSD